MSLLSAIERIYSYLRIISLDVAAAALGGGILATRVIGSTPRPAFYWLLPAGVWVAYTVDHLLDGRRMGPLARTPRHRFHYRYSVLLWITVCAVSLLCAVAGWIGLSWFGLVYAAIMCGLVLAHETIIKLTGDRVSPWLVKELGVAIVFTAGVWGMPWLRHTLYVGRLLGWPVLMMVQYFLLAFVNLIEFSIYESKLDAADGQTSFVRGIGRKKAKKIVVMLLVTQFTLAIVAVCRSRHSSILVSETLYQLMAIGLYLVLVFPRVFARRERYRTVGDGVFILPLLMWLIH